MTYKKTAFDQINTDLVTAMHKLQDVIVDIVGTRTSLLRIFVTETDLMGDSTLELSSSLIDNCVIEYPFSDIEILTYKDQVSSLEADAISMWDLLPIKIIMKIDPSLSTSTQSINLDENDYIVDVLYDQSNNKIPIIMKAPVLKGTFMGKHLIQRTYEATLQRGLLEDDIQTVIDDYVDNLGIPEISSSVPVSGASGVALDTTIAIIFNVAMNETSVANYLTIIPSGVIYTTSWDSDDKVMTLTPIYDLSSGVVHYVNIAEGAESSLGVASEDLLSINFIT